MTSTTAYVARQAREARTRTIRRRVVSGALSLFVGVWAWIALVLVSGHDPVLGSQSSTSSNAALSSASGTSGTSGTSASGSQSSGGTASSVVTRTS